ncbi:MAG: TetR/AcrR family transcriptional regulator [Saprospiraceae bacterium]
MPEKESSTELKILEAARVVFREKGFAATRTRDIAEAAGINLALLNYYYRSKKNLYDIVMAESMRLFFDGLLPILNREDTTLREKVERMVGYYIDVLVDNPDLLGFIITEVRTHPDAYMDKMGLREKLANTAAMRQLMEGVSSGGLPPVHPLHLLINLMGLTVFPFVAAPLLQAAFGLDREVFVALMQERKQLIPQWVGNVGNV